ncbi:MAG: NAD-binding protein, partial [Acidimicrobiales bacterium]|nr:NAD-binding protein [Acidimicrobiales bacterium]
MVIGLGRFGSALAGELEGLGSEVLGVDADARRVQDLADGLTHVVQADTT